MKKYLFPLVCLSGLACADNYYIPSSNSGDYIGYDAQPSYALEALYGINADSDAPDMWGFRASMNLFNKLQANNLHSFNLNIAYMAGSDEVDAQVLPITMGYDLNLALNDKLYLALGAKAGISYGNAEAYGVSESDWAFTYSAGVALKYQFSDAVMGKVGYEFARSYFDMKGPGMEGSDILGQHIISVGLSYSF